MSLPIVVLIGPPNVGKSTLLNKIAGKGLAVTSDVAGTTRDRQYADVAWNGATFTLVDTAGLNEAPGGELEKNINKQIQIALAEADLIIVVTDGHLPPSALGQVALRELRKIKKPLALAVNKLDSPKTREEILSDFRRLGIKNMFGVSAISGRGIGDLLDFVAESVGSTAETSEATNAPDTDTGNIAVAILGKPNVGKSSIFNAILKQERAVVSAVPGTTRTAVDSQIKIGEDDYTFIDTAGLKKKDYRQDQPDVFSGFQSFKAIRRSDICLFVIDANEEMTKQDQKIAGEIFDMQKGCIILANKIDLAPSMPMGEKKRTGVKNLDDDQYQSIRDYISHHFPFLWMCPLFFVSATEGKGIEEALAAIKPIFERRRKQIDQQALTDFLRKLMLKNPPKLLRDQKRPKIFGLRQTEINPPKFELLVNHPAAISQQFRKFVENSIIKFLDFYGTPIVLKLKGKDKS